MPVWKDYLYEKPACGSTANDHFYKHAFRATLRAHALKLDGKWGLDRECRGGDKHIRPFQCNQVVSPVDVTLAFSLPVGSELLTDHHYISPAAMFDHTDDSSSILGDYECPTRLFRQGVLWNTEQTADSKFCATHFLARSCSLLFVICLEKRSVSARNYNIYL